MTCIIGLVHDGRVYIGGDSAGIAGWDLTIRNDPKVFRNGPFLIGFSSSFRMGQLLRYSLKPPLHENGIDTGRYLTTTFIDAVRDCLKAGGYARKESEQENAGFFLLGYQGRLFRVDSDYQVGESLDGYDAVGCGSEAARGALYAAAHLPPRKRIRLALKASEHLNAGVRGPFHIEMLEAPSAASFASTQTA